MPKIVVDGDPSPQLTFIDPRRKIGLFEVILALHTGSPSAPAEE